MPTAEKETEEAACAEDELRTEEELKVADEPEMTGEPRAEDELKMTGEPETEDGETDETVTTVAPRRDCGAGGQKNTAEETTVTGETSAAKEKNAAKEKIAEREKSRMEDVWKDVTEKRVVSQRKI